MKAQRRLLSSVWWFHLTPKALPECLSSSCLHILLFWIIGFFWQRAGEWERWRDVSLSHNICSFSPNLCKQQFPWWFRLALFSGSFEYEMCLPEFTVTQRNFRIRRKIFSFPPRNLLSEIRGLTSPADTPAQIANWIGIPSTKLLILNFSITFAGKHTGRVKGNPSAILFHEIAF